MIKWLINTLVKAKVNQEINKIKRTKEEDFKRLDKASQNLRANQEQLDSELDLFCRMHPDSPLCKNRGKKIKY